MGIGKCKYENKCATYEKESDKNHSCAHFYYDAIGPFCAIITEGPPCPGRGHQEQTEIELKMRNLADLE